MLRSICLRAACIHPCIVLFHPLLLQSTYVVLMSSAIFMFAFFGPGSCMDIPRRSVSSVSVFSDGPSSDLLWANRIPSVFACSGLPTIVGIGLFF